MTVLGAGNRNLLWSLAEVVAPGVAGLDERSRSRFFEQSLRALSARPPSTQRQFRFFLFFLRFAPLLRWGRPFDSLPLEKKTSFLAAVASSPLTPLRLGFWGLKAIICIGYYGQPELGARFGYSPSKNGNEVLRGR